MVLMKDDSKARNRLNLDGIDESVCKKPGGR